MFLRIDKPWPGRISRWGAACLLALLLCGCRTVPPLSPVDVSGPGWKVQRGQALWRARSDATEIAGELYLASHTDGRSLVQFSKSPIPLIVAQTDTKYWQVNFVPRDKTYDGKLPPTNRLIWPHLSNCLNGAGVPEPWQFERLPDDRWRIENPNTGERLEGYVEPGLPSAHLSEAGDTLNSIARRYGVTVRDLRAVNNDMQMEGEQLRAGQTLRIPTLTGP